MKFVKNFPTKFAFWSAQAVFGLLIGTAWPRLVLAQNQITTFDPPGAGSAADQTGWTYSVTELPGLGGTMSLAESINDRGWVSGWSNLSGDQTQHAFLWVGGDLIDLGTLGGPDSAVGSPMHNELGELAGYSNTSQIDPLGEQFCFTTPYLCAGFAWRDGKTTALPTLGGNNSTAAGVNNWGFIVGFAETAVQDANCVAPQVLDFKGVIWGPEPDEIKVLPPLPGDSISAALTINDAGLVGGASGQCGPIQFQTAAHAVLWENGNPINLATLGGAFNNAPLDMNERGDVVGISDLPGDTTTHAALWHHKRIIDLAHYPATSSAMPSASTTADRLSGSRAMQAGIAARSSGTKA